MEWLFMIMWPNYVPKKVREEIQGIIENYFREPKYVDNGWNSQHVSDSEGGA